MAYTIPRGQQINIREFGDRKWVPYTLDNAVRFTAPIATQTIGTVTFLIFAFKGWEIRAAEQQAVEDSPKSTRRKRNHSESAIIDAVQRTPGVKRGSWERP